MKRGIICTVFCIAAITCIIIGITQLTNNQYKASLAGYHAALTRSSNNKASSYSSQIGLFKYGYDKLSEKNLEIADEYAKVVKKYRTKAIALFASGVVLLTLCFIVLKIGRKKESEASPQAGESSEPKKNE